MSAPQTFPNAQAVEGGLAVDRFAALAADMRAKLRPIARTRKHFVRAEAIRYLEVIDGREAFIAANPHAADICAERALARLGPNGLGPAINGFTRYHGEQ